MDRHRRRWNLALLSTILCGIAFGALADQGVPVYTAVPTLPTAGAACRGNRVQVAYNDGKIWCCVANAWAACGSSGGGATPAGSLHDIQRNGGSGALEAYPGTSCTNQFARSLSASGAATCSSVDLSADTAATVLPAGKGGLGAAQPTCTAGQRLTCGGTTCTCVQDQPASGSAILKGNGSGLAVAATSGTDYAPATSGSALLLGNGAGGFSSYAGSTCSAGQAPLGLTTAGAVTGCFTPAGTYTLPIAGNATLGGVQGTGSATQCSAGNHAMGWNASGVLQCASDPATSGTSVLLGNGSGGFSNYAGSTCGAGQAPLGLTSAGAVTGCFTPAGTYSLPAATTTTLGGVIAPSCSAGSHYASISAGTLQCVADSGGGYTLPAAQSATLGGVMGTGSSLTCATGNHAMGFNASGNLQCAADPSVPSLPLSGANGGLGATQPSCGSGQHVTCNGTTCSCSNDAVLTGTVAMANGGTGTSLTNTAGGVLYGSPSGQTISQSGGGAAGTILINATANTPSWLSAGLTNQGLLSTGNSAPNWTYKLPGIRLGSDWSTTSTTPSTIISWTQAVAESVSFRCQFVSVNASTSAIRYNVSGPSMNVFAFRSHHITTNLAGTDEGFSATSSSSQTSSSTSGNATTAHIDTIEGFASPSAAGTVAIQGATSASGQTVRVYNGSVCEFW